MRGSPVNQVHHLFNCSGINQIGTSKHEAKESAKAEGAKTWADKRGEFQINKDSYRDPLRTAAMETGQEYRGNGIHGLRWNYARERMDSLQKWWDGLRAGPSQGQSGDGA